MIPAIVAPFTSEDVEAGIVKNEAGIIYNNLLNLVPPIKGYIKAFVCLSFVAFTVGSRELTVVLVYDQPKSSRVHLSGRN